jgi:hypothetical protein
VPSVLAAGQQQHILERIVGSVELRDPTAAAATKVDFDIPMCAYAIGVVADNQNGDLIRRRQIEAPFET